MRSQLIIQHFSPLQDYSFTYQLMRSYTLERTADAFDQVWLLEHAPVYTQGQAGKAEHILNAGIIPVVQSDRGGQVTYHGPGQLMIYTLCDLKRLHEGIKAFVTRLEQIILQLLKIYDIQAHTQTDAPGVFVGATKICSLGLRVRKGCTYHGLCLNVAADLSPFQGINPCGISQLAMSQLQDFIPEITMNQVIQDLKPLLLQQLTVPLGVVHE